MPILFACDRCQRAYELPDVAAGRQAKCECGEMLTVPLETPPQHAAPPAPSREDRRSTPSVEASPPLAAASVAGPATGAAPADLGSPSIDANKQAPPPIPPVGPSAIPAQAAAGRPESSKYRKLREYQRSLRFMAKVIYWMAALITVATGLLTVVTFAQAGTPAVTVLAAISAAVYVALIWVAAYVVALLHHAAAEFLEVVMDIEENTRK